MGTINLTDWALMVLYFAFMVAYSYLLGEYVVQAMARISERHRISDYRKWGLEREIFHPASLWWFTAWGVVVVLVLAFTFLLAAVSLSLLKEHLAFVQEPVERTFGIALLSFLLGLFRATLRFTTVKDKVQKLTNLHPAFHQRFSVAELLGMYEALRFAPDIFWEEYANLDETKISDDMNRRFRASAAPYQHGQLRLTNVVMVAITVLIFLLTGVLAAIELISRI